MVDFNLPPHEARIIRDLNDFLTNEITPLMEKHQDRYAHDSGWLNPDATIQPDVLQLANELRRRSAKHGYYAMHLPQDVGGLGVSYACYLQANQTVFRHGLGLTLAILGAIEGPNKMLLALDEPHRQRWLTPLIRGDKTTCFALTEPTAGSDVRNIQTTATKDGDHWILNGTKTFITNGPYADFTQVFAKTGNDGGMGDITAFIVERNTPGFTQGPMLETIANNGLPCELHFNDCRIPADHVIGDIGEGFYHALQNINDTRIQNGGMALGLAQHCLDKTIPYLTQRTAFGKPISKYQGISFQLADSLTELRAAQTLALYAAWKIDQGEDAIQETSMTKLTTTETLWNIADRCIQAHGATGTLRQTGLERILRWARVMRIWEGTSEIQRMTIAKTMGL